jgi:hypothetical protein
MSAIEQLINKLGDALGVLRSAAQASVRLVDAAAELSHSGVAMCDSIQKYHGGLEVIAETLRNACSLELQLLLRVHDIEILCCPGYIESTLPFSSLPDILKKDETLKNLGIAVTFPDPPRVEYADNVSRTVPGRAGLNDISADLPINIEIGQTVLSAHIVTSFRVSVLDRDKMDVRREIRCLMLGNEFWKNTMATGIFQAIAKSVSQFIDGEITKRNYSDRYAVDLGEIPMGTYTAKREYLVLTVLGGFSNSGFRLLCKLWEKTTAYKWPDRGWVPNDGPSSQPKNVNTRRGESYPLFATNAITKSSQFVVKIRTDRLLDCIWYLVREFIDMRRNDTSWQLTGGNDPGQVIQDPSDKTRNVILWSLSLMNVLRTCVRGEWRWYNWELRYNCYEWRDGIMYLPLLVLGTIGSVMKSRKRCLVMLFRVAGREYESPFVFEMPSNVSKVESTISKYVVLVFGSSAA